MEDGGEEGGGGGGGDGGGLPEQPCRAHRQNGDQVTVHNISKSGRLRKCRQSYLFLRTNIFPRCSPDPAKGLPRVQLQN
jgi:hypothetical protein